MFMTNPSARGGGAWWTLKQISRRRVTVPTLVALDKIWALELRTFGLERGWSLKTRLLPSLVTVLNFVAVGHVHESPP